MSAEKYRLYALECFRIAEDAANSGNRMWLIKMAQSWLLLAKQAEKNLTADLVYETPPPHKEAGGSPVMQQQQQTQRKEDEDKG
jgi:hypothetical protein